MELIQNFLFIAEVSYVLVGLDLLRRAKTTRRLPEFFLGLAFVCNGLSYFFTDFPIVTENDAILDEFSYTGRIFAGLCSMTVAVFVWRTFRAEVQLARWGVWAIGADALPAWMASIEGYPGFAGMDPGYGDAEGDEADTGIFHFPDGNASIARMLVRKLIPGIAPGNSMEDIVAARFDYAGLDRAENLRGEEVTSPGGSCSSGRWSASRARSCAGPTSRSAGHRVERFGCRATVSFESLHIRSRLKICQNLGKVLGTLQRF